MNDGWKSDKWMFICIMAIALSWTTCDMHKRVMEHELIVLEFKAKSNIPLEENK